MYTVTIIHVANDLGQIEEISADNVSIDACATNGHSTTICDHFRLSLHHTSVRF